MCNAELPIGKMISFKPEKTLRQMCEEGAIKRKINLKEGIYKERLDRELEMIASKKFEDYLLGFLHHF